MTIKNLNSDTNTALIEINTDEAMCITNALYRLSCRNDIKKDPNFNAVRKDMYLVSGLLKHGLLTQFDIDLIHNLEHIDDKD